MIKPSVKSNIIKPSASWTLSSKVKTILVNELGEQLLFGNTSILLNEVTTKRDKDVTTHIVVKKSVIPVHTKFIILERG